MQDNEGTATQYVEGMFDCDAGTGFIGDAGVEHLAKAIATNKSLIKLDLRKRSYCPLQNATLSTTKAPSNLLKDWLEPSV